MIQRMLGPRAISASALALETGLNQSTLSRWLRAATDTMPSMSTPPRPPTPPEIAFAPPSPRRPEDWSPEERLRVALEASRPPDADLGPFLRPFGLHEPTLAGWR